MKDIHVRVQGSVDNFKMDHLKELIDMFTDSDFFYGTYRTTKYFLKQNMTIFPYILTYRGNYSLPNGVGHGDDLIYLFDPYNGMDIHLPENDLMVRKNMISS